MQLETLGGLRLLESDFRQTRSLVLLTYLVLEGAKPRRFIADLFWPEASDPMNSVAVAISKLRKLGLVETDEAKVWATTSCDAAELSQRLRSGQPEAVSDYRGAFLETVKLSELSSELEEWVYNTRETLACEVRSALLTLAEQKAAVGHYDQASSEAEQACTLPGAPPLEPEDLVRCYSLMLAAQHPYREVLEREAKELNLYLPKDANLVKQQLRRTMIGRDHELAQLASLEPGQWAWLRGGSGIGKTTLLRELASQTGWRYISARSGLPFATLETLLDNLEGGEETLLRRLASKKESFILDGWDASDPESRTILTRLRTLKPAIQVVVSSHDQPPFAVDTLLELGALTIDSLASYAGAYEATAGSPILVGAWLRGEPLETALQNRLAALPETTRQVYGVLALLDPPDLTMIRQALSLDAVAMAKTLDDLTLAGLTEPAGTVRGREAALHYLQTQPSTEAQLSLAIARFLPAIDALPFFRKARPFWQEADVPKVSNAYLAFARETLRRGFPMQAATLLTEAPITQEINFLRAKALEQAGNYKDALPCLESLPDTPEVFALKSAVYRRLGRVEDAKQAAQEAIQGDMEARAEGLNTLGHLEFAQGQFAKAESLFARAAALFQGLGERERWLMVLNNRAYAKAELGEDVEEAFREVLSEATDNPVLQILVFNNIGRAFEKKGKLEEAKEAYLSSIDVATHISSTEALLGWTNLGALYHRQNQISLAKEAYEKALGIARQAGNRLAMGVVLSNLAELTNDLDAWHEAIDLLEFVGEHEMAAQTRKDMEQFVRNGQGEIEKGVLIES